MGKSVEFFFDIVSPASYLAWTQLPKLAEESGATIEYRPFFLPGVFEKTGNSSPITVPAKGKWLFRDLVRHARMFDVPFVMNDNFPMSSVYAMRGLNNYRSHENFTRLADGFFNSMWAKNEDINAPNVVGEILSHAEIDVVEYQEKLSDPASKQALIDVTEEAVTRGVFGAPTFFVGKFMHWGQDRIQFVKDDLLN